MDFDASTPTYAHDANGNLTGDGVFQYQYDAATQLTNVVRLADGARVLSARYDALGRRVEATRADGSVERYVYFPGSFLVLTVLDGTNAVKEIYTRGPDLSGTLDGAGGIGGILACTYASGATYCSHADIMGNIIALTDASGSVAATFRYTPFGQLSARTGTLLPRYLFSSKEFDRTANLYYYGYRYYAPRLGRWMTRDPLEELDEINLNSFSHNRPTLLNDFWGLACGVVVRRLTIDLSTGEHDPYGHEWIEIDGGKSSYGWWPKDEVSSKVVAMLGVPGAINRGKTQDPYNTYISDFTWETEIDTRAWADYCPTLMAGQKSGILPCKCATCEDIRECLDTFAHGYGGQWATWRNCRTFVSQALKACCLLQGAKTVNVRNSTYL